MDTESQKFFTTGASMASDVISIRKGAKGFSGGGSSGNPKPESAPSPKGWNDKKTVDDLEGLFKPEAGGRTD